MLCLTLAAPAPPPAPPLPPVLTSKLFLYTIRQPPDTIRRPPDYQAKMLTTRPSLLCPIVGNLPDYIPSLCMGRTCGFLVLFLIDFCFKQNTMGYKQNTMGFKQNTMGFKQNTMGFKQNTMGFKQNTMCFKHGT